MEFKIWNILIISYKLYKWFCFHKQYNIKTYHIIITKEYCYCTLISFIFSFIVMNIRQWKIVYIFTYKYIHHHIFTDWILKISLYFYFNIPVLKICRQCTMPGQFVFELHSGSTIVIPIWNDSIAPISQYNRHSPGNAASWRQR